MASRALADRFWEKVHKGTPGGCWLWTATTIPDGYGMIMVNRRSTLAHRVSWELANGPIPEGLRVLHRCDVPPCVNPSHLFLGTQAENMADARAKGRTATRAAGKWQRPNWKTRETCKHGHPFTPENTRIVTKASTRGSVTRPASKHRIR